MQRYLFVIAAMTVIEVAWTLLCELLAAELYVYYLGLVAASVVFFVPRLFDVGKRAT